MRNGTRELPTWLSAALVGATVFTVVLFELVRPLRRRTEPTLRRTVRNLAVAAPAAVALSLTASVVTRPLSRTVQGRGWGLVKWLRLPPWLEVPAALLLLDYTLYLWHVALHRVPFLWRFHQPHHVDLDLDASTAVRFHVGELLLSIPVQAGQVVVIGVSPLTLSIWGTWLLSSVLFHHSNAELPLRAERRIVRFVVTPRMHGIHHSIVREETDSNWSSGLTLWDRLHGTLRLDVPQHAITIGVPAHREPAQVSLGAVLAMPLRAGVPDPWRLPGDGVPTRRRDGPGNPSQLEP